MFINTKPEKNKLLSPTKSEKTSCHHLPNRKKQVVISYQTGKNKSLSINNRKGASTFLLLYLEGASTFLGALL